MLLDWMDSCSCMVLWPPRAHRAQLYACYIGRKERLKGQTHTAHKKQSATVDESNDMKPERRSGRQRETVKPDITLLRDHQTQQHQWKDARYRVNTAYLGTLNRWTDLGACRAGGDAKWSQQEPELIQDGATCCYTKRAGFVLPTWLDVSHWQTRGHVARSTLHRVSSSKARSPAWSQSYQASNSEKAESWRACFCLKETLKTYPVL